MDAKKKMLSQEELDMIAGGADESIVVKGATVIKDIDPLAEIKSLDTLI